MMNMKNLRMIVTVIAITGFILAGCSEMLTPDDEVAAERGGATGGNDGEENALIVDEGLMLYNMPGGIFDLDEGTFTTPETFGRKAIASDGGDVELDANTRNRGKYLINGPMASTSKLDSGGFTDVQFIHYKEPLEGEFTLRARVLMTAKAGDSSSKGYFFGAFTGTPVLKAGTEELDYVEFKTGERGAGLLYRTNDTADGNSGGPAIRPYFKSDAGAWSTGPTKTSESGSARPEYWLNARQPSYKQERILEVVRQKVNRVATDNSNRETAFIFRIYDSKTGVKLNEAFLDADSVHESVRLGQKVYVGIALLGSSVEFSEIAVWDNKDKTGEPLFKTPETEPAYVPVESFTISTNPNISLTVHPSLPNTSRTRSELPLAAYKDIPITLIPNFLPDYADNDYFDWKVVIPDMPDGITVEGIEGSGETGYKRGLVTITKTGSAVIMATSRDPGLADYSIEIRVR
jgi:hypothetical protein